MGKCIFIKSACLFKKPETFVSKIDQEHWVQSILSARIWQIVEDNQDTVFTKELL